MTGWGLKESKDFVDALDSLAAAQTIRDGFETAAEAQAVINQYAKWGEYHNQTDMTPWFSVESYEV